MGRFRTKLFTCSVIFWIGCLGTSSAQADAAAVSSWLKALVLTSPKPFTETRYDSLLEIEFHSKGTMKWKGDRLKIEYHSPSEGYILWDNDRLRIAMKPLDLEAPLDTFPQMKGLLKPLKSLLQRDISGLETFHPRLTQSETRQTLFLDFSSFPSLKVVSMNMISRPISTRPSAHNELMALTIHFANGDWRRFDFDLTSASSASNS